MRGHDRPNIKRQRDQRFEVRRVVAGQAHRRRAVPELLHRHGEPELCAARRHKSRLSYNPVLLLMLLLLVLLLLMLLLLVLLLLVLLLLVRLAVQIGGEPMPVPSGRLARCAVCHCLIYECVYHDGTPALLVCVHSITPRHYMLCSPALLFYRTNVSILGHWCNISVTFAEAPPAL